MTAPSAARRSVERTKAPPLPGLTCWDSRILKTVPSTSMWFPFLNWFVEITVRKASPAARSAPVARRGRGPGAGGAVGGGAVSCLRVPSDGAGRRGQDVGLRALHD